MKICIAGKNRISVNSVEYLLNTLKLSRGDILILPNDTDNGNDNWQPSLKRFAITNNLRIVKINEIYDLNELVFFSLEYNRIIKPCRFKSNRLFNIHFSYLPSYKGMYTSVMPILFGEKETGVTLHKIDAGIDTGEIIDRIKFSIKISDTCRDLYFKYMDYGEKIFQKNINLVLSDNYSLSPQKAKRSTYFSKNSINFNNVDIDFNKTSYEIHNQIRAFIFEEYQLPVIKGKRIKKSILTKEKIKINSFISLNNKFNVSGIDGYKVVLETI
jgi:methionyl-tRNA formyltransferase